MIELLLIFALVYAALILLFSAGLLKLNRPQNREFKALSIIIAARNEEKNLPALLYALARLEYPEDKYEIIIINDRSEDKTRESIEEHLTKLPNLRLITLNQQDPNLVGKKGALQQGILAASHEHLVFTDADCLPGKLWLKEINSHWSDKVDFWAGYSPLILKNKLIFYLKNLERASIFAITAGSFGLDWGITCTARNMGYRKSLFFAAGGFKGIGQIPSGDDDLLLQKMSRQVRKYNFLFSPQATVWSRDRNAARDQVELETRRGSKWKYYPFSIKLLSSFVFIYFITFCFAFLGWIAGLISSSLFLTMFFLKVLPEFLLLTLFLKRVKQTKFLQVFPLAEILYIPYFLYFAIKGTLGKYKWK